MTTHSPKQPGTCQGLNCSSTELIEAHIIPEGFGRLIRDEGLPNYKLQWHRVGQANPQLGEYDPDILCGACDNKLGVFDEYALDTCKRFEAEHQRHGDAFELADVDGDKFATAILAILWRASISKRPNFTGVCLGQQHEQKAREVLFGALPLSSFHAYQLILERFTHDRIRAEGLFTHPVRNQKGAAYNFYSFALGGFRILAKIGARRFPRELAPFIVNGSPSLRGTFVPLQGTETHAAIIEMLALAEDRDAKRQ